MDDIISKVVKTFDRLTGHTNLLAGFASHDGTRVQKMPLELRGIQNKKTAAEQ